MCLTGVDYFSTLGYQPGIAFAAAGLLSPFATMVLVLLTLIGALPVYHRIAALSPNGQGSLSVLEERLPRWRGKGLVLVLLGFAATAFIITITMSAADATAHIVENPLTPGWLHHPVGVTFLLLAALGGIFLRGLPRGDLGRGGAGRGLSRRQRDRDRVGARVAVASSRGSLRVGGAICSRQQGSVGMIVVMSLVVFPKLALGLSGFETGVAVMPLVRGHGTTPEEMLQSRIVNTRKLLSTAALIMSVLLIGSSLVTTTMIPPEEFARGGRAEGRALAFLAHRDIGDPFATIYDLATIGTLWFAGSSALAGLLNLVPQYLPRYGMAPDWARATRPLVLLLTGVCLVVTVVFEADVTAQAGAYATGVLALMTSAAFAVAVALPRQRWYFAPISLIFAYTTLVTVYEQPEGIHIAGWFIISIIGASLVSRVLRSTEVRIESVEYDATAGRFVNDAVGQKAIRIVASRPNTGRPEEYARKFAAARDSHHLPDEGALFLEVTPGDASDFTGRLAVVGVEIGGYRILRCKSPAVPNAIAGLLLDLRDRTDAIPHAYFGWTEGNPIAYLLKFLAFGEGDTAPVCREVLRKAEPDPARRPRIHVG